MFAAAYSAVKDFSRPVLLADPSMDGKPGCGTFIVVNRSGWIITAKHVLSAADADSSMAMWGWRDVTIDDVFMDSDSDMAIGRLKPFDDDWISEYPTFCGSKDITPGMSVGRLGYTLDGSADLSSASALMNSGVISQVRQESGVRYILTSIAGIKGQSGGPVFDREGAVCGMQVSTRIAQLGYNHMREKGDVVALTSSEGMAVHVDTMREFLDATGVSYRIRC